MKQIAPLFRKILLLLCIVFIFTSCGDDEETGSASLNEKVLDNFTISIPASWPLVPSNSDGVPTPSSGKAVLIAGSDELREGISNNIVILAHPVVGEITDKQYALQSETGLRQSFYSYREIESGDMKFDDEVESHYSVFEAQYNRNTPRLYYLQTARICHQIAYNITLTLSLEATDPERYKNFVSTFSCNEKN